MKKICVLIDGKDSFWAEHGQRTYTKSIVELLELISDDEFEVVYGGHNDFYGKWEDVKRRTRNGIRKV